MQVWMTGISLLLLATLPSISVADGSGQDDASTGGDASGYFSHPTWIGYGTHSGGIEAPDDTHDFFGVAVGEDEGIQVSNADTTSPGRITVFDASSAFIFASDLDEAFSIIISPPSGAIILRFFDTSGRWDYSFDLAPVPLPDLAVDSLAIENVDTDGPAGPQPLGVHRMVHFSVSNAGRSHEPAARIEVEANHPHNGGAWRPIWDATIQLAVGAREAFSTPWDGTGAFGDATVRVRITAALEQDLDDNARAVSHYVVLGGTGVGLDLLHQERRVNHQAVFIDGERLGVRSCRALPTSAGCQTVEGRREQDETTTIVIRDGTCQVSPRACDWQEATATVDSSSPALAASYCYGDYGYFWQETCTLLHASPSHLMAEECYDSWHSSHCTTIASAAVPP